MTTLPDFLLARIAEDEARFRWGRLTPDPDDPGVDILRWDDERGRAECEAKRRIVEGARDLAAAINDSISPKPPPMVVGVRDGLALAMAHLALPYAAHEDWREEWGV